MFTKKLLSSVVILFITISMSLSEPTQLSLEINSFPTEGPIVYYFDDMYEEDSEELRREMETEPYLDPTILTFSDCNSYLERYRQVGRCRLLHLNEKPHYEIVHQYIPSRLVNTWNSDAHIYLTVKDHYGNLKLLKLKREALIDIENYESDKKLKISGKQIKRDEKTMERFGYEYPNSVNEPESVKLNEAPEYRSWTEGSWN